MVDWMIEVLTIYKQSSSAIFKSIYLLDLYLKLEKESIKTEELHLVGITVMFITSKVEELRPLMLREILEEIAKGKFSKVEILNKEKQILKIFKFDIHIISIACFSAIFFELLQLPVSIRLSIERYAVLLQKMYWYSYDIVNVYSSKQLAVYSSIISLKLYEHSHKDFSAGVFISRLIKLSDIKKECLVDNLNFLRDFASNFREEFPFNHINISRSRKQTCPK
jgi:hypothetical protein